MKGISKAFARTPHMVGTKVGLSKQSNDPEFEDYHRKFGTLEDATTKLLKDCAAFNGAISSLLSSGQGFSAHFAQLFESVAGEYDLLGKHPYAAETLRNVPQYQNTMEDLRTAIAPELELIDSRIVGPSKEFQVVLKNIRKSITKRQHKLVDYDRHNKSLTKLRDKKEKSLNDEKQLFKVEQDFEVASSEYEAINGAMKTELPQFITLATRFIDPLFHSFYYMQLNVFYLILEKMQGFCEGKYETGGTGPQIASDYEAKRSDAAEKIQALGITKRVVSTLKMMQTRQGSVASSATSSTDNTPTNAPPTRTPSSTFAKKIPPPPPSSGGASAAAPPPPYTAGAATGGAAAKRGPPPPPPLKPKPKPAEVKQYVVALYDFAAQADGDLDFRAGDRIELVERSESTEDWWTGKLNGKQGVFPGNYVQEA